MKLEEFLNKPGEVRNDPLLDIVKKLRAEKANLIELRRAAQGYLIPVTTKSGKIEARLDPDLLKDAEASAKEIEACKDRIASLDAKIKKVDEVCAKHGIERPLLKELVREKIGTETSIARRKAHAAAVLGKILQYQVSDLEKAQKHPDYLKAVAEYETWRRAAEPRIERWEAAIADLKEVI